MDIPLGGGLVAVIDRADADLVAGFRWRPLSQENGLVYAHAQHRQLHVYMHRLVIGAGPEERVDHEDRDGLNNRRRNLRLATVSENGANRPKDRAVRRAAFTSRFKGVFWDSSRNRWVAQYTLNNRTVRIGRFDTEEEAARAYDVAALEQWGEFARLNFPEAVAGA